MTKNSWIEISQGCMASMGIRSSILFLISFLQNEAEFSDRNQSRLQNEYGDQIINLSSNKWPKGLITLESVFDRDDQARGRVMNLAVDEDDHTPVTVVDGKSLNMGKVCSEIE